MIRHKKQKQQTNSSPSHQQPTTSVVSRSTTIFAGAAATAASCRLTAGAASRTALRFPLVLWLIMILMLRCQRFQAHFQTFF